MRSFGARNLLLAIASALRERPPAFTFEVSAAAAPSAKALSDDAQHAVAKAAHDIDLIAGEITADHPDRGYIERLVEGLPEQFVGSVVPALVAAILAACP
jgi:hypothetical protein